MQIHGSCAVQGIRRPHNRRVGRLRLSRWWTQQLAQTSLLQKADAKNLNKVMHPALDEIKDKLVWPNPNDNVPPTIDLFMLHGTTLLAFQMTVSTSPSHTLDIGGCNAVLSYFDSMCKALNVDPKRHSV